MPSKLHIDIKKSLLETIKGSTGSRMFRHLYIIEKDHSEDILKDGEVACAFYVTSILKLYNLIDEIHTTVNGALKALKKSQWKKVSLIDMRAGDILVWDHEGVHAHIGFAISHNRAISNSSTKHTPVRHSFDFAGTREVITVLRHELIG